MSAQSDRSFRPEAENFPQERLPARNRLPVNGLGGPGHSSTGSNEASTEAFEASSASFQASFALFEASELPAEASFETDQASIVAYVLPSYVSRSRFASNLASSASVLAIRAAIEAPIRAPQLLFTCPQVSSRPPPATSTTLERSPPFQRERHKANHFDTGVNDSMSTFPTREADIVALANDIATGLATHTDVFPAPPHAPEEIREALSDVTTAHEAAVLAAAQARQSTTAKLSTEF